MATTWVWVTLNLTPDERQRLDACVRLLRQSTGLDESRKSAVMQAVDFFVANRLSELPSAQSESQAA